VVIIRFVDIGGIVDHHSFSNPYNIKKNKAGSRIVLQSTKRIITTHYNSLKMILVWDWYKNVAVNIFCNKYFI
jgi:hypothetical protein